MNEAQTNATESTSTVSTQPAAEAVTSAGSTGQTTQATQQQQSESAAGSAAANAAIQAAIDYKFKYRDGDADKVEGELDDWVRQYVNAENAEKFKEVWAKAHGLDFVKNRFNKTRDEYKTYKTQVDPLLQGWNQLTELYNKGDMDSFFKGLQIPEQKIFQYVLDKLQYNELPPEQRALKDQQQQMMRREMELEKQNQFLQQQYQQTAVNSRNQLLDVAMSKPEVSSTAQAFDAKVGREGAFREEVIKRGILAWHTTGQDISPEQAIAEVLHLIGTPANNQTQNSAVPGMAEAQAGSGTMNTAAANTRTPPVLPNVGAKNTSPAKRGPRSLEEIRKLAAQMN